MCFAAEWGIVTTSPHNSTTMMNPVCISQEKWYQAAESSETLLRLLQSLPIFKAAYQPRARHAAADAFVDLSSRQCFLAPEGTDAALLTEDFITANSEAEAAFLCNRLGVQKMDAARFLEETVFSR